MSDLPNQRLVSVIDRCFVCGKTLFASRNLRGHLETQHSITLPARTRAFRRDNTPEFMFIKATNNHPQIEGHFGNGHFINLNDLEEHVRVEHAQAMPDNDTPPGTSIFSFCVLL